MGKAYGLFRGTVADTSDTLKLGRIRVRIEGFYDDEAIQVSDIPWALPAMGLGESAGSGSGSFFVPKVGTRVYCMFEGGDVYSPVYIASALDGTKGQPTFKDTNYPDRMGHRFDNGVEIYVDKAEDVVKFTHPAGTSLTIDADGNITVAGAKDRVTALVGDETETIGGDEVKTIAGKETHTVVEDNVTTVTEAMTVSVGGILTVLASSLVIGTSGSGDCTVTIPGNISITATGTVSLIGSSVYLN